MSKEACPKAVLHYGLKNLNLKIIVAYSIWQNVECLNHSEGVVFFFSLVLQRICRYPNHNSCWVIMTMMFSFTKIITDVPPANGTTG